MPWIGNSMSSPTCAVPRALGSEVAGLLHRMQHNVAVERRMTTRSSIPYLFELVPAAGEVPELLAQPMVVIGKDIAARGISFYHQKPIPYRRGVMTIDLGDEGVVRLEIDLLWCRFTSLGWYESGGRLLGVTKTTYPAAQAG